MAVFGVLLATAIRISTREFPGLHAALGDETDELQLRLQRLVTIPVLQQALGLILK